MRNLVLDPGEGIRSSSPRAAGAVLSRSSEVRGGFIYLDILCPYGHEMSKRKTYTIFLSLEDRIDVDLEFERRPGTPPRLFRFALTYSAWLAGRWREVVRYDNFHGYLHRRRLWRTRKPEPLRDLEKRPAGAAIEACREELRRNWRRYRSLMESAVKEE